MPMYEEPKKARVTVEQDGTLVTFEMEKFRMDLEYPEPETIDLGYAWMQAAQQPPTIKIEGNLIKGVARRSVV